MILRDRRLRFVGHNMRHVEPITNKCITDALTKDKPGKWAKLILEDLQFLAGEVHKKNLFAKHGVIQQKG